MSGAILETWVVSEIIKSYRHAGRRAPLFFYRDRDKKEIDLLIDRDGTLYPLEIKKTAAPQKDDVRHFKVLERLGKTIGQGGIICLYDKHVPVTEDVWAIPVSAV